MTTALGKAAWEYWGKFGVPVFPCSSNKRPLTPRGFYDAVTDKAAVEELFAAHPNARYIGAATGKDAGFFVIDFDLYKEDTDAIAVKDEWEKDGYLPKTRIHKTKSGGLHYLYRMPVKSDVRNGVPADGIEIRGTGGYVIVPPSVGYEVLDEATIAEAPAALVEHLRRGIRKFNSSSSDYLEGVVLDGTNFHEALMLLAARRQSDNEDRASTQRYLMSLIEASTASNPAHARHGRWLELTKDSGRELSRIVSSAYNKYNTSGSSRRLKEAKKHAEGERVEEATEEDQEKEGFRRSYDLANIHSSDHDKPFVVHPLFMEGDVIVLSADPKAGKSLFAMTLALHMGAGISLGNLVPVRETGEASPVPCVYFALEGQSALRLRILAWLKETGMSPKDVAVHVVEEGIDFTSPRSRKYVVDNLVRLEEQFVEAGYGPIGLVVIDTLTKAMPGKDQNKVEDTSEVFDIVRHLRDAGINACVMYLHHNRRDGEMPRGSSNIMAEPDTVISLKKHGDRLLDGKPVNTVEMNIYMARAIDDTFSEQYAIQEVGIGVNSQGIERKSAVLKHVTVSVSKDYASKVMDDKLAEKTEAKKEAGEAQYFYDWLGGLLADKVYTVASIEDRMSNNQRVVDYYKNMKRKVRFSKDSKIWSHIINQNPLVEVTFSIENKDETAKGALRIRGTLNKDAYSVKR